MPRPLHRLDLSARIESSRRALNCPSEISGRTVRQKTSTYARRGRRGDFGGCASSIKLGVSHRDVAYVFVEFITQEFLGRHAKLGALLVLTIREPKGLPGLMNGFLREERLNSRVTEVLPELIRSGIAGRSDFANCARRTANKEERCEGERERKRASDVKFQYRFDAQR